MMTIQDGAHAMAMAMGVVVVLGGCGGSTSKSAADASATSMGFDGHLGQGDGAVAGPDWSVLARLDTGYFKQNCTMGFDIAGRVFSEYADTVKRALAFQGEILGSPDFSRPSGKFTIRITVGGKAYGAGFPAGKYTVVKWSDFNGGTVSYRIANKNLSQDAAAAFDSVRETQAEAERDFTDANGYFLVYCCPYANHYLDLRLLGTFKANVNPQGFVAQQIPDPAQPEKTLFQFTAYDDVLAGTVRLQGTIGRTNDLTAPYGYWRIQVTKPGTSGFATGQYTVAAWQMWDGRQVQLALPEKAGAPSTTAVEEDALLTFTPSQGYFTFNQTYSKQP